MPSWKPDQYLQFEEERTRPCRDLVSRISLAQPDAIIDLGCGPGNSTAVLAERWPSAIVTGLDGSAAMLEQARRKYPKHTWVTGDIVQWAANDGGQYDVVFSNAALQWVPNHATVVPQLLSHVRSGGVLAVQVPINMDAPAHQIMRDLASSTAWRGHFPENGVREWHVHDAGFYYDALAPVAKKIDIWETEYLHIMPSVEAIGEWYKGSGLRPFLDVLASDEDRSRFTSEYVVELRRVFQPRSNGSVLFPFHRLFLIAGT